MSDPLTIIHGDALSSLRTMESESVQTCVTSPPYWGLRSYGTEPVVWSNHNGCEHEWRDRDWYRNGGGRAEGGNFADAGEGNSANIKESRWMVDSTCLSCGAWRGELGLEPTPDLYVQHLVEIFRELKRVLRSDGTLWLNLGDSYSASGKGPTGHNGIGDQETRQGFSTCKAKDRSVTRWGGGGNPVLGLPPKNLVGVPWRVAFALQADGWVLRSDIIWSKPNPMPESVIDRPTKSHEYVFLLSKSQRYFYDAEAIAEPVLQSSLVRAEAGVKFGGNNLCPNTRLQSGKQWQPKVEGPNSRINRSRDPAHEREYEGKNRREDDQWSGRRMLKNAKAARDNGAPHDSPFGATRNKRTVWTVATAPFQDAHFATFPPDLIKPCILAGAEAGSVVLDPFAGSGTTAKVAIELGRKVIAIEPKAEYVAMIKGRCQTTIGLPLQSATA